MKNQLLLALSFVLLSLGSCSKKNDEKPFTPTGASIQVKIQNKLNTGEITTTDIPSLIEVWDETGKTLKINSVNDALSGYALDTKTNTSFKYMKGDISSSVSYSDLAPGNYFAFIMLNGISNANKLLSYSYVHFTVTQNNFTKLNKIFSYNVGIVAYEDWNANQ